MQVEDRVIGRVSGEYAGYKNSAELVISARITKRTGLFETVTHTFWWGSLNEIAISMGVWNRAKTDFIICGQGREALDNMVSYAAGWDARKVARLANIWDVWHLNLMNAGCIHQSESHEPCPVTGYEYGHKWLVRNVPDSVVRELTDMFA